MNANWGSFDKKKHQMRYDLFPLDGMIAIGGEPTFSLTGSDDSADHT